MAVIGVRVRIVWEQDGEMYVEARTPDGPEYGRMLAVCVDVPEEVAARDGKGES